MITNGTADDGNPDDTVTPRPFKVYVGGPIDQAEPVFEINQPGTADGAISARSRVLREYFGQRRKLVARLRELNRAKPDCVQVYAAWEGTQPGAQTIEHQIEQQQQLDGCDLLVAFLPQGIATVGTPIEIWRVSRTRPVIVIGAQGSETIRQLGPRVIRVDTIDQAMDAIVARVEWITTELPVEPTPKVLTGPAVTESGLRVLVEPDKPWALPVRHYADDAGLDLFVTESTTIAPSEFADIPAGVRVQLPERTWGMIVGRSSTIRKRGLLVVTGIIDTGYRGDLFVAVLNISNEHRTVSIGDRVGQLIVLPNLTMDYSPMHSDQLDPHARGENGFGSTGMCAPPALDRGDRVGQLIAGGCGMTSGRARIRVPTVHEQAAAALLDPYLADDPPEEWFLIDNADADDVRHALEVAIGRLRALPLAICGWHHLHRAGDPVPCVQSRKEAEAVATFISGRFR